MIRLFLSTDIVGSTSYKAGLGYQDDTPWPDVFKRFFRNYPILLTGRAALEFEDEDSLPPLEVWKVMGDEVIFMVEPSCAEHVVLILRALFNAMTDYERDYFEGAPLRLKSTAWLALFPRPNIEIEIPELGERGGAGQVDFIGPDIDLGFRVAKFARPSMITVPLDLAETLLKAANADRIEFHLAGREPLKGVFNEWPYPIIWVRPTGAPLGLDAADLADCPLLAAAAAAGPIPPSRMQATIEEARDYLHKIHGVRIEPLVI
jgi:hypothetical protein